MTDRRRKLMASKSSALISAELVADTVEQIRQSVDRVIEREMKRTSPIPVPSRVVTAVLTVLDEEAFHAAEDVEERIKAEANPPE